MSDRKIAVAVGVLFITQMITAMIGTSLTKSFVDGAADKPVLPAAVALMMVSGLAVVGIGLLMYRILKSFNQQLAIWYPILRVVEFTVSAVCGVYLLTQLQVLPNAMLWVYLPTTLGGLVLGYLLLTSKIVPRPIAILGLVGYAALLLGTLLDFGGVIDLNIGVGMAFLAPGGLFEVLVLPIWLFAKGFKLTSR